MKINWKLHIVRKGKISEPALDTSSEQSKAKRRKSIERITVESGSKGKRKPKEDLDPQNTNGKHTKKEKVLNWRNDVITY